MTSDHQPIAGRNSTPDPAGPARILVVKLSSLGDVVHVTPCLKALRRAYPRAEIVMAVDQRFADVVRDDSNVNVLIRSRRVPGGTVAWWFQTVREIAPHRERPFDLAVDFQGTQRSALWVYASRARVKAGRGGWRPGWRVVIRPDFSRHAVRVCADIAERIGIPVRDLNPELHVADENDRMVGDLLKESGMPGEGFVVFNPFSRWRSKVWPFERYAELARRLREKVGAPMVVSGGPGEEGQADELMRLMRPGDAVSLAGKLTLGQSMALYKRSKLMVTGDTGPMHVAAALGTRVVALFGPTFPERTGPWGEGHVVLQALRPPRHHAYRTDRTGAYMEAIDVNSVFDAVQSVLGRSPG